METQQMDKQLQMWNRLMFMVLGSSITLLIVSFGNLVVYGNTWPGFDNYTGALWPFLQFAALLPGFYLLWSKPLKTLPLGMRLNTAFGYFLASWIYLLALVFIIDPRNAPDELIFIIIGSAILIALGYVWALRKTSTPREEMFP